MNRSAAELAISKDMFLSMFIVCKLTTFSVSSKWVLFSLSQTSSVQSVC
jgi:hypothetical protein